MEITNNILRDYSDEDHRIYFIDLDTGIKVEVLYINGKIILIRSEIEREDIQRATSLNIDLNLLKKQNNNKEKNIEVMKKIVTQIKDGILSYKYPNLNSIEFHVDDYGYLITY